MKKKLQNSFILLLLLVGLGIHHSKAQKISDVDITLNPFDSALSVPCNGNITVPISELIDNRNNACNCAIPAHALVVFSFFIRPSTGPDIALGEWPLSYILQSGAPQMYGGLQCWAAFGKGTCYGAGPNPLILIPNGISTSSANIILPINACIAEGDIIVKITRKENYNNPGDQINLFSRFNGTVMTLGAEFNLGHFTTSCPAAPTISINPTSAVLCPGIPSMVLTATGTNFTSLEWNTIPVQNTSSITVSPSATTTYQVKAIAAPGCTATAARVVTVPIVTVASSNTINQCGESTTLSVTASSGNTITQVVWTAPGQPTVTNNNGNSIVVSPNTSVVYTATVTTSPGSCVSVKTVNVVNNTAPTISVTGNTTICPGESVTLCANPPLACTLLNPGDIAIVRYRRSEPRISFLALVDLPPCISINFTNHGYDQASNSLVGSGNIFTWTPSTLIPAGTVTTITPNFTLNNTNNDQIIAFQGNTPATWRFLYAINKGAAWTIGALPNIDNHSNLPPGLVNDISANSFVNNFNERRIAITAARTKAVWLTDIGINSNWDEVFAPAVPNMTVTDRIVSGYSWNTSPVQTTPCITITQPGTYTVTYVDPHGCNTSATQNIDFKPAPLAPNIINSTPLICTNMGSALLTVSPVISGYTYRWYTLSSGGTPVHTGISYNPILSATTTYYVESYSTASCSPFVSLRTPVTVTVNNSCCAPFGISPLSATAITPEFSNHDYILTLSNPGSTAITVTSLTPATAVIPFIVTSVSHVFPLTISAGQTVSVIFTGYFTQPHIQFDQCFGAMVDTCTYEVCIPTVVADAVGMGSGSNPDFSVSSYTVTDGTPVTFTSVNTTYAQSWKIRLVGDINYTTLPETTSVVQYTFPGPGLYNVLHSFINTQNSHQYSLTRNVQVNSAIREGDFSESTEKNSIHQTVNIYPVPFSNETMLSIISNENEASLFSVSIVDMLGKIVYKTEGLKMNVEHAIGGNLTSGVYTAILKYSEKTEYVRIIKK